MAGGYPGNPQVEELQRRREKLRQEIKEVEARIAQEEALLQQSGQEKLLHHRPSYSLLKGGEEAIPSTFVRQVSPQDFDEVLRNFPLLDVGPIGSFNHWDRRECAVQNKDAWKAVSEKYQKEVLKGNAQIPKVIHQIWIGPKEPPCLWIDTFRVEYLAANPGWGFHLWSDEEVAKLPMINEEIYNKEKMWQCKADILRLEFLWHHGGLYVDADMISVETKPLDKILELGKETGWVIAYEPDTKDKPYSILGNSVIACTPHHPLTLMLILYLKQTFDHKRNHIDVFAVTGPVMYTKCLVDSGMPISIAPQEWLYPAFHYVPNPDAINFGAFPKCLMFQFGYTCSGLEGYVKSKNRCKKARQCPFHSKKVWPFGPFKELPKLEDLETRFSADATVPKVIHQVILGGLDSNHDPQRWRQSWWDDFCKSHPGFEYRTWSKEQLQGRKWFCANLYVEPFDDHAITSLMMEILFEEGGFYVPLSTLHQPGYGEDAFFTEGFEGNFVEGNGGVLGAGKGSPECFQRLMELYEKGAVPSMAPPGPEGPRVLQMGFRDGMVLKARYPNRSRYLGAQQVVAFTAAGDQRLELATLGFSYECQVPCFSCKGVDAMREAVGDMGISSKALFLTDREFFQMDRLRQELPGFLDQLGVQGWDAVLLGVEWNTGQEEVVIFPVVPGGRPQNCKIAGLVVNLAAPQNGAALRRALQRGITEDGFEFASLFEAAGQIKLQFLAEKYAGSMEEARIFRSMPLVHRAFKTLADHEPPMHFEQHELHGNLMKGFLNGSLRFEMILEPNGGIMFRCWNEDNSTNSEVKMSDCNVEWLKVYFNHQVCKEIKNEALP
ncbi:unnamed protein product [Cladocopium goreaui]|uniref:Uncharacterized protein n=1 Tax=Cladocopium goreaui TaxID=2562237 RepID=A0A9P1CE08_9DINO|nr:unnamed protein product [Cladocopium goreaui]